MKRTAWNKGKIEFKECKNCGSIIRKWQTYCSHECYIESKPKGILLEKVCLTCQKPFKVRLSQKNQKNCSNECAKKASGQSKSGKNHPMFGKHHTNEVKQKISMVQQNVTNPKDWQGFVTQKNKSERMRFRYEMQKKIFERDGWQCVVCSSKIDLQVDHIQKWSEFEELRFDINNCRTLCSKCHYQITFGKPMPENIKTWGHNFLQGGTQI